MIFSEAIEIVQDLAEQNAIAEHSCKLGWDNCDPNLKDQYDQQQEAFELIRVLRTMMGAIELNWPIEKIRESFGEYVDESGKNVS